MKHVFHILLIVLLVGCSGEKTIKKNPEPHTFPMPMEYRSGDNETKADYCGGACLNYCNSNDYAYFNHGFNGNTCMCWCSAR